MFPGLDPRAKLPGLFLSVANTFTALQTFAGGLAASAVSTFNAAVRGGVRTLTSSGGSLPINLALGNYFEHTLTENTTLANPTNMVAGQTLVVSFTNHASSPKTLAFGSAYKFPYGAVPSLTASNGGKDTLVGYVRSGTQIDCMMLNNVS